MRRAASWSARAREARDDLGRSPGRARGPRVAQGGLRRRRVLALVDRAVAPAGRHGPDAARRAVRLRAGRDPRRPRGAAQRRAVRAHRGAAQGAVPRAPPPRGRARGGGRARARSRAGRLRSAPRARDPAPGARQPARRGGLLPPPGHLVRPPARADQLVDPARRSRRARDVRVLPRAVPRAGRQRQRAVRLRRLGARGMGAQDRVAAADRGARGALPAGRARRGSWTRGRVRVRGG